MKRSKRSLSTANSAGRILSATVEACVQGEIDLARSTLADGRHDLVVPQLGAFVHLHVE
jgi:hypothetical protein